MTRTLFHFLYSSPVLILQTKTLAALPAKHGQEKRRLIRERCFGASVWSQMRFYTGWQKGQKAKTHVTRNAKINCFVSWSCGGRALQQTSPPTLQPLGAVFLSYRPGTPYKFLPTIRIRQSKTLTMTSLYTRRNVGFSHTEREQAWRKTDYKSPFVAHDCMLIRPGW